MYWVILLRLDRGPPIGSHVTLSTSKILFLLLATFSLTATAQAAAPVGQTIWIRASAPGLFVSANQNRGTRPPPVADRSAADAWETQALRGAPPGFSRLVWSEEFTGSSINTANWGYDLGNGGFGNKELQNYTSRSENARIVNGMLVIEARRDNFGGSAYTSARLKTQGKQSFGINTWVEARINVPEGQGIWPAFWMLGNSISTVGWPSCGEIDIMEIQGQNPFKNFGTIHWADANGQHVSFGRIFNSSTSLSAGFHTYAISRTESGIKWYVDRVQYAEANISGGINSTSEFQGPFFIILNVAVGGNFVGSLDGTTVFPQRMQVDWVRVWGN